MAESRKPGTPLDADGSDLVEIDLSELETTEKQRYRTFLESGPAGEHLEELEVRLAHARHDFQSAEHDESDQHGIARAQMQILDTEIRLTREFAWKVFGMEEHLEPGDGTPTERTKLARLALTQDISKGMKTAGQKRAEFEYLRTLEALFERHLNERGER